MAGSHSRDPWDPERYGQFARERAEPFEDLLRLVEPRPGMRVADLGCGTGELTRRAHERLAAAETIGIDSSAAMLERAAACSGEGLRFERGDAGAFGGRDLDLVLSNAALHWIDDHAALLPRLAAALAPGGQLAIQVPANDAHPSHAIAREVAAEPPFRELLGGWARVSPVLAPERYAELLDGCGFARQRVRLEVYLHRLPSRDAVVEWVRGAVLTAYESRLPAEAWPAFLARYRARLVEVVPDEKPFRYAYRRLFLWARCPA